MKREIDKQANKHTHTHTYTQTDIERKKEGNREREKSHINTIIDFVIPSVKAKKNELLR